tara:strand:- start:1088 stop:1282 length:195 start_codon:yes stop_codon:yes gene_type:complete
VYSPKAAPRDFSKIAGEHIVVLKESASPSSFAALQAAVTVKGAKVLFTYNSSFRGFAYRLVADA